MHISKGKRSYYYIALTIIITLLLSVAIYYSGILTPMMPASTNANSIVDEEYAGRLADTIETFLYFMNLESVSKRVPLAYVIPAMLPILSIPTPGIAILNQLEEQIYSYSRYYMVIYNTTFTSASNTSGYGVLKLKDLVNINSTLYGNYTLNYGISSISLRGNITHEIRYGIDGYVLASTNYDELVFKGCFEGVAMNRTYKEWFETIIRFDNEYRPTELHVYINNSNKPIIELYFDYNARKTLIVIDNVNTTMGFAEGLMKLRFNDIEKRNVANREIFLVNFDVLLNNTNIGNVSYMVDPNGIPIALHRVSLKITRQEPYGSMLIEFSKQVANITFRE